MRSAMRFLLACIKRVEFTVPVLLQGQMGISTSASKQDWSPSPGEQNSTSLASHEMAKLSWCCTLEISQVTIILSSAD